MSHRRTLPIAIGAAVLVTDQVTKHIAAQAGWINYDVGTDRALAPLTTEVGTTAVLGLVALGLLAVVIAFARRSTTRIFAAVAAAGIVGNRVDQLGGAKVLVRWTTDHPAVINWITLPGGYVCNLADLAICLGLLALSVVACVTAIRFKRAITGRGQIRAAIPA